MATLRQVSKINGVMELSLKESANCACTMYQEMATHLNLCIPDD